MHEMIARTDQMKCGLLSIVQACNYNVHLYRPQLTSHCLKVIVHLVALLLNQMHFWQRSNNQ